MRPGRGANRWLGAAREQMAHGIKATQYAGRWLPQKLPRSADIHLRDAVRVGVVPLQHVL